MKLELAVAKNMLLRHFNCSNVRLIKSFYRHDGRRLVFVMGCTLLVPHAPSSERMAPSVMSILLHCGCDGGKVIFDVVWKRSGASSCQQLFGRESQVSSVSVLMA